MYIHLYIYMCDNSFYLHEQLHRESMLIMPEKSTWQIAQELRSAPAHTPHARGLLPAQGAATTCITMTTASVENRSNPKSSLSNLDIHIVNFRRPLHIIELSAPLHLSLIALISKYAMYIYMYIYIYIYWNIHVTEQKEPLILHAPSTMR